jgi:hypothetical protein
MIDAPMVARIDHVSEPGASCVAEKHVSVDLIEAAAGARPAHAFAMIGKCKHWAMRDASSSDRAQPVVMRKLSGSRPGRVKSSP